MNAEAVAHYERCAAAYRERAARARSSVWRVFCEWCAECCDASAERHRHPRPRFVAALPVREVGDRARR